MTERYRPPRKVRSEASDSSTRQPPSSRNGESDKRLTELEEAVQTLRAQVQTNNRRLTALQAQLDHVAAKQRS
jgi:hypothetical protein